MRSKVDDLKGEIRNINPPTFDGDHNKYEDVKCVAIGNEEIFPISQLFIKCRIHNCSLPYSRKSIDVVRSTQES